MRLAITGGTGFGGGHLAKALSGGGHEVVVLSRGMDQRPLAREVLALPGLIHRRIGIDDVSELTEAFAGCDAVAHCAGINREIGSQTYGSVHITGTANVVSAAERAGVRRLALLSFLRARPDCGSDYHESKWAAEEIVRRSECEWTVLKPGMMFGKGDQMLDHLSHAIYTFPTFLGIGQKMVRPLAVEDLVEILEAALVDGRLVNKTVGIVGPSLMSFDDAARLVAKVVEKRRLFIRAPLAFHSLLAEVAQMTMKVPPISHAQLRILKEEVIESVLAPDSLDSDLAPETPFDEDSIRGGLPEPGRFNRFDLRWFSDSRKDETNPSILVFDGDCGFCTTTATWAERRFTHGERAEAWQFLGEKFLDEHGLSIADVQDAAWWIDGDGKLYRGHRAVGRAFEAVGGFWKALGWFALTPPTSWLASAVYRLVVRWRYRLPGGTPACKLRAPSSP